MVSIVDEYAIIRTTFHNFATSSCDATFVSKYHIIKVLHINSLFSVVLYQPTKSKYVDSFIKCPKVKRK